MTEQHIALLRRTVAQAQASNSDIGLGANVLAALLDERDVLRADVARLRAVYMDLVDHEFEPVCDEYDDGGAIMADGAPQCAACGHPLIIHSAADRARAALTPQHGAGPGAGE